VNGEMCLVPSGQDKAYLLSTYPTTERMILRRAHHF
jgi:hypothetical protein